MLKVSRSIKEAKLTSSEKSKIDAGDNFDTSISLKVAENLEVSGVARITDETIVTSVMNTSINKSGKAEIKLPTDSANKIKPSVPLLIRSINQQSIENKELNLNYFKKTLTKFN